MPLNDKVSIVTGAASGIGREIALGEAGSRVVVADIDEDGGERRARTIISILGQVGFRNSAAYVAAKDGVVGLTRNAALEYAADEILCRASFFARWAGGKTLSTSLRVAG